MDKKSFVTVLKAAGSETERYVIAQVTSTAVDRDGDVIIPDGCDATDFTKNPICFDGHDYSALPVGTWSNIKRERDGLVARLDFAPKPADWPDAQPWKPYVLHSLYQSGVMRGFSIGFKPIEGGVRKATAADIERFGPECVRVFSKWKLGEISTAALPCNQDALAVQVSKGVMTRDNVKAWFGVEVSDEDLKRATAVSPAPKATPTPAPPAKPIRKNVIYYCPESKPAKTAETLAKTAEIETRKAIARAYGRMYVKP